MMKHVVLKAVQNFLKNDKMLETNLTHICLIPKGPNVDRVEGFRLISLCNISYKIISKCTMEKMKAYLLELISANQSAFISGRSILKSILAQELLTCFNLKSTSNKVCIQLDISKAFDSIAAFL